MRWKNEHKLVDAEFDKLEENRETQRAAFLMIGSMIGCGIIILFAILYGR